MLCPCLLNTGVSLCLFGECIYDVFVRFFVCFFTIVSVYNLCTSDIVHCCELIYSGVCKSY